MGLPKFDTLGMAKKLEEKVKFGRTEAENLTEILAEAMQSSELATKNDLKEVKTELESKIDRVEISLKGEIAGVKAELESKIDRVEISLKSEIAGVKGEIAGVKAEIKEVKTELEAKIERVEIGLKSVNERLDLMKLMMIATFTTSFAGLIAIITAMIKSIR